MTKPPAIVVCLVVTKIKFTNLDARFLQEQHETLRGIFPFANTANFDNFVLESCFVVVVVVQFNSIQ